MNLSGYSTKVVENFCSHTDSFPPARDATASAWSSFWLDSSCRSTLDGNEAVGIPRCLHCFPLARMESGTTCSSRPPCICRLDLPHWRNVCLEARNARHLDTPAEAEHAYLVRHGISRSWAKTCKRSIASYCCERFIEHLSPLYLSSGMHRNTTAS